MTQIILQRVFLSTEIFLACILVIKSFGAYSGWKVRSLSRRIQLPFNHETGKPLLLYFWTTDCAQCKPQEQQIEREKIFRLRIRQSRQAGIHGRVPEGQGSLLKQSVLTYARSGELKDEIGILGVNDSAVQPQRIQEDKPRRDEHQHGCRGTEGLGSLAQVERR